MLITINSIAAQQAAPTKNTTKIIAKLLNYAVSHPDSFIRYHTSRMVLHINSAAPYMYELGTKSRVGGHCFLSNHTDKLTTATEDEVSLNGPVHSVCKSPRNVMTSTAEAEMGALFVNDKKNEKLCAALEEMGHK
eukprot:14010000-Ditylum_brightwellii.AAC.1